MAPKHQKSATIEQRLQDLCSASTGTSRNSTENASSPARAFIFITAR
jgi:hypothetical protein